MRATKIHRVELEEGPDHIPEDLLLKILMEQPVKSLLRFRCVSKRWRSLIDDPRFVDMHRLRSYHRPSGVKLLVEQQRRKTKRRNIQGGELEERQDFVLVDEEGTMMPVPHPMEMQGYNLSPGYHEEGVEGVEGLICFDNIVWNPTTRKSLELPPQCLNNIDMQPIFRGVYTPKVYNVYYLGFDAPTKQYKVLSISEVIMTGLGRDYDGYYEFVWRGKFHFQIITLGTNNAWKDITHHVPEEATRDVDMMGPSLYFKNEIYFLVRYPTCLAFMVFSIGEEKFKFLCLPKRIDAARPWRIIEVRESVALMEDDGTDIWVLTDFDTGEWEKIMNPIPPKFDSTSAAEINNRTVICAINATEVLLQSRGERKKLSYFYCDIKKGSIRKGPNLKGIGAANICSKHVETLFDPSVVHSEKTLL